MDCIKDLPIFCFIWVVFFIQKNKEPEERKSVREREREREREGS
jgi:tRNA (Thr-GGU) A37 N-methylase